MSKRIFCALPWHSMHFHADNTYGRCCHIRFKAKGLPSSAQEENK